MQISDILMVLQTWQRGRSLHADQLMGNREQKNLKVISKSKKAE